MRFNELEERLRRLQTAASNILLGIHIHNELHVDAPARKENFAGPVIEELAIETGKAKTALEALTDARRKRIVPQFEIFSRKSFIFPRQWYWRLRARNGEIVAQSEGYTSFTKAANGTEAVRRDAPEAVVEVLEPPSIRGEGE
jgi:uncharacterized protein YegP (UPF0339 family)